MPTISTLTAVLELDKDDFEGKLDSAKRDLDGFGERAQQTGQKLTSAGKTMTAGITAPLTAMGALSARTAANFDQAMQRSIAVLGDVDEAMRENLEERAREVANTTTHSAEQAAESYYYLASAGLDAAEAMEAMPQVAAFATAGNMDMAQATDVATNVMSAFGYEASEMSKVTDSLTATVANHNQTMQGMSSAMSKVAPVASSLGISIEETAGVIGMLGDVGIQGEEAGTALRNVMTQLSDESSTASKELEEMGVTVRDSEGNLLSFEQILRNMNEAGVEASDAAQLFGQRAGPAMAELLSEGGDALEENTETISNAEDATQEMADTQEATLNAELQKTRSNIEDVGITIGSQLVPMLSTASRYVRGAAQQFQGLSDGQQKAIIAAAGVAAALGPVLMMAGLLAQSVVALSGAYGVLAGSSLGLSGALSGGLVPSLVATNVALLPITGSIWTVIAVIGALVAAVGGLYLAWDNNVLGIRDTATDAFSTIKGWFDQAPSWFFALLGPLGALYAAWRENLFGVKDLVGEIFNWIGNKIDWLMEYLGKIPGIEVDDGDISVSMPEPDVEDPDPPSPEEMEGSYPEGMNPEGFEQQGQQAGQSFGSGFQSGLVENIEPEEVESHLQEQLDEQQSEKSDLKRDIDRLERLDEQDVLSESGQIKLSIRRDELSETQNEISTLEGQLESARNAEDITDVDSGAVASLAEQDLEEEQERAEYIQSVYGDIEGADAPSAASGPSISPEEMDGQSVESMLAESESGGGTGEERDGSTLQSILEEIQQLRTDLDTLRLAVEMDLNSREFRNIIDDRAEAVVEETVTNTGP